MNSSCVITYVCCFLISMTACSEKDASDLRPFSDKNDLESIVVPKDSTRLIPSLGLVYYKKEAFTGTTELYNENNILIESIRYLSGRRNGFYKKWFSDGSISYESRYVKGKQQGKTLSWWRNGNLRSEANFENAIAHGLQKQWYESGAKFKEIQLNMGKEEGLQKSWRENGKIYNNYEAKDGRIFGLKRANLCFSLDNEQIVLDGK